MTGCLQIKKGKYYAVLNFKNEEGKRVPKWYSLGLDEKGNKRRAEMMLNDLISQNKDNDVIKTSGAPLFTDYIIKWLNEERGKIANSTWESYETYARKHIIPYFEKLNLRVDQVRPAHIKEYYETKARTGRSDKKSGGMSYASLKNHSKVLKQVLNQAMVVDEFVLRNVALNITIPHILEESNEDKAIYLDAQQANQLLAVFQGHRLQPLIYVTLYYGLRRSEVLGLKWDAIDFARNKISIKHVIVKNRTIEAKDRTKTVKSKGNFELLPEVKILLLQIQKEQEHQRILCGNSYHDTGYVFTWENGLPYRPDFVTRAFQAQLRKAGLPNMRFHDLRHSTASILIDKGWGLKEIQEWLRHTDIETTGNIYTHITQIKQKMMAKNLENTFDL